jgi:hypothetical protein
MAFLYSPAAGSLLDASASPSDRLSRPTRPFATHTASAHRLASRPAGLQFCIPSKRIQCPSDTSLPQNRWLGPVLGRAALGAAAAGAAAASGTRLGQRRQLQPVPVLHGTCTRWPAHHAASRGHRPTAAEHAPDPQPPTPPHPTWPPCHPCWVACGRSHRQKTQAMQRRRQSAAQLRRCWAGGNNAHLTRCMRARCPYLLPAPAALTAPPAP